MSTSPRRRATLLAACVASTAWAACDQRDVVAVFAGVEQPPGCADAGCDAANAVEDGGTPAETNLAWCACEDLLAAAMVTLVADDGGGVPASLGVRGGMHLQAPLVVDGALFVGPAQGITGTPGGALDVGADLWVDGDIDADIAVQVDGDAFVAGDVRVRSLQIGGVLTQPATGELSAAEALGYASLRRAPIQLTTPCGCDATDLSPAATRLQRARDSSTVVHLDDARYGGFMGPETLALDCGEHWVTSLAGDGDLTIDVTAPATLYVDGAVSVEGALDVRLTEGATLTFVVAEGVRVGGSAALGTPERPERVAIIADGSQVVLTSGGTLHGPVIAPAAELRVERPLRMRGSLQVRRVVANGALDATFVAPEPLATTCN